MIAEKNGRVTLRDIMNLQKEMYKEIEKINDRITGIHLKVVSIAVIIPLLISTVGFLIVRHYH